MTDPQSLHKSAWTHVRRFGDDGFPVFNLTPKKRQGCERDFESPPMEPLVGRKISVDTDRLSRTQDLAAVRLLQCLSCDL